MLAKFKVEQSPELRVSFYNNMPATTAIAAVRTAFGRKFITVQMRRTCPSVTGAAAYLHIINKIGSLAHLISDFGCSISDLEDLDIRFGLISESFEIEINKNL